MSKKLLLNAKKALKGQNMDIIFFLVIRAKVTFTKAKIWAVPSCVHCIVHSVPSELDSRAELGSYWLALAMRPKG